MDRSSAGLQARESTGSVGGQFLQRFGQFAQHTFARCIASGDPDAQYLVRAELRGHLGHPERSIAAQDVYNALAFGHAAKPRKRFQQGHIGFGCAVGLDALPPGDPWIR